MTTYAVRGQRSRDLLTYGGRVITHTDRAELEFLLPGADIVECPPDLAETGLPVQFHPDMASVRWPLDRRDFRR